MLWKNELTEIRNENAEQISGMNGAMWDQLSPTVEYLSSFSIPMFEEEVIKKDLIGMAKEAEIEQKIRSAYKPKKEEPAPGEEDDDEEPAE